MHLLSRLLTLVCALALTAHASAPCAGWKVEEQARLDCCASHCPMEEGGAHHGTHEPVPAPDAAACCAISERSEGVPAAAVAAPAAVLVLLPERPASAGPVAPRDAWRPAAPVPVRTISTHLFHSVLLV